MPLNLNPMGKETLNIVPMAKVSLNRNLHLSNMVRDRAKSKYHMSLFWAMANGVATEG